MVFRWWFATLRTTNCHDAHFVTIDGIGGCWYGNSPAIGDETVVIMTTTGSQCDILHYVTSVAEQPLKAIIDYWIWMKSWIDHFRANWWQTYICEISLRRLLSPDLTDHKSTLVYVMAWCHQATSYYLSQCWPRSTSSYGVSRPSMLNKFIRGQLSH